MRRFLKVVATLVALGLVGLAGLAAARQTAFLLGAGKADEILGAPGARLGPAELKRLALWTHRRFQSYSQTAAAGEPLLYRLATYMTNRRIPTPFRLPPGAVETLYGDGVCDSAARTLGFLAESKGLSFRQYNLIAATAAHSAVEIGSASGPVFVDPFFGVIEREPAKGADALMAALKQGAAPGETLTPLDGEADLRFYQAIDARAHGGFQNGGLDVDFSLPPEAAGRALGERDGRWEDVGSAGRALGISVYFSYLGSRFDRSWRRVLRAEEPLLVKVFTVGPLDRGLIDGVVAPAPEATGEDWALWRVGPERPLVLDDSRSPLRLSLSANWQAVDRIEISRP